jgi:predicted Fe-Mo cluster-binding NifX family protein
MKVCITAQGATPDSLTDERFGRAPYFVFMDTVTGNSDAIANPYAGGGGGVGPKAAQLLIEHGATVVITGQVGGNAQEVLAAGGISIQTTKGSKTVRQAFEEFGKSS